MYYVYIIKSKYYPNNTYVGYTTNIKQRIISHNKGQSSHTSKYKPWILEICFAFREKSKAIKFEKYLKSSSGRAFIKKRF